MTDKDAAFLWETAALRDSPQRLAESELDVTEHDSAAGRWVTLREASRATGIPVETLRKWARRATIPTYLATTAGSPSIRMVDLDGIRQRAADLGRTLHAEPSQTSPTSIDLTVGSPAATDVAESAPPGTMIVPIDAWNKMLNQLGNLHEAGQQLAEARERAAKAETEATFLRERLSELRLEPLQTEAAASVDPAGSAPATTGGPPPEKVWQFFVRRLRGDKTG